MKKILATVLLFITLITSGTLCYSEEFKPFEVKPLNYSYVTLEPYIDKETMMIHHDKHYKNYVDKLNAAIKKYPNLYSSSLTDLLTNLDSLPEEVSQTIKNNGGGVYNHEFFFDLMTSKKTIPCGELEKSINRDFGSLDKFKEELEGRTFTFKVKGCDKRTILIDKYIYLMSREEICADLDFISLKTYHRRLNEGLTRLKKFI